MDNIYSHKSLMRQGWHPQIFMAGLTCLQCPKKPLRAGLHQLVPAGVRGWRMRKGWRKDEGRRCWHHPAQTCTTLLTGLVNNLESSQPWDRECWDAQSSSLPQLLGAGVPAVLNHSTSSQAFFCWPIKQKQVIKKNLIPDLSGLHSEILF